MRWAVWLLIAEVCAAASPPDRLSSEHLEAVHAQRIAWIRSRISPPLPGIYRDFRAVSTDLPLDETLLRAAKDAGVQVLLQSGALPQVRDGIVIAPEPKLLIHLDPGNAPMELTPRQLRRIEEASKSYPDEAFAIAGRMFGKHPAWMVSFRYQSVHVFALDPDALSLRASLDQGRDYAAADWLCDPTGFYFMANNNLGAFDIGDTVPLIPGTRLQAFLPIPAKIRLLRDGKTVSETEGRTLDVAVQELGAYRLQAFLTIDGEEHTWITSNAIHFAKAPAMELPVGPISSSVEVRRDIAYIAGRPEDAKKHRLDLYLPKGRSKFPVMMFVHGGAWSTGDRAMYAMFGSRFAQAGIGVVIPSYRLMPRNPHPAQIEDVAAAFAWVYRNIAQYGGDKSRLYLAGHSAGGHLVSLLALDRDYQEKYQIPVDAIHGVISMSGIYDVGRMADFQAADDDPSPIDHVQRNAPPFLVTYCQWDYPGLPKQARDFAAKLKSVFAAVKLAYIPGQGHISEMIATLKEDDPTARAILDFIR